MIKRVILDIDNTLIDWKNEYNNVVKSTLEKFKIKYTEQDYQDILDTLDEYENVYYSFDIKLMSEFLNKYTNKNYSIDFLQDIINGWGRCVPESIDTEIIKTLEYLKQKYELVILTDWYAKPQSNRLEMLGILKYFKKIYSAESVNRKPFKEAFLNAIGENKPEECVMIGDNLERDIKGAINAGLKAIWYNPKNKYNDNNDIVTIKNIYELEKIL